MRASSSMKSFYGGLAKRTKTICVIVISSTNSTKSFKRSKIMLRPHPIETDFLSPADRSALMSRIGPKDSKPEMTVRRLLHRLGYRYGLHRRDLPGTPDIVFPIRRKAIFVHGCFWHRHSGCKAASTPKSRKDFWSRKFDANVERDARKVAELEADGWTVAIIWSCETQDTAGLASRLTDFLANGRTGPVSDIFTMPALPVQRWIAQ